MLAVRASTQYSGHADLLGMSPASDMPTIRSGLLIMELSRRSLRAVLLMHHTGQGILPPSSSWTTPLRGQLFWSR